MSLDLAQLRRLLVDGWPLGMDVAIRVGTLKALLDELERLRALEREARNLAALSKQALRLADIAIAKVREMEEGREP